MSNKDIRWIQRFENYLRALSQLLDAVELAANRKLSNLEQQGLIQAFEYTHELAWNTLQDFLYYKGNEEIYGSKDVVRASFKYGLIEEGEIWMDMINNRNKTSHTYNEETAQEIIRAILSTYHLEFIKLQHKLEKLKEQK
ncbi:MAG: nucleotidyltransferase [Bacteroidetes bacterium RIFCSPLOWO2_12_FULL_31_6]|nr:MAG: nucleotidyltransferase [Bacteroidetes bacterium RIFCSPLOWO2_12_FULL_31_6]